MSVDRHVISDVPSRPHGPRRLWTAARDANRRRPWIGEILIFAAALVVYQLSRAVVIGDTRTAFSNAADIITLERQLGLYLETDIQRWMLEHLHLTWAMNIFYVYAHWIVTTAFFVWLYRSRRAIYPYVRNAFLAANAIALVIFMLFPVAPPRLLAAFGFVDSLNEVSNIDLHGGPLAGLFNQYAAVPSMHFGYAFMIGIAGAMLVRSWPMRAIFIAYPVAVFIAIVATANHFVIDSLAGSIVIVAGFTLVAVWAWVRQEPIPPAAPTRVEKGRVST